MTNFAIRTEGLGKRYRLGERLEPYSTLRETLVRAAAAPLRALRERHRGDATAAMVWALRDVSFSVQPGEVVGVVGRNGAGKSTLLKILSRITRPSEGFAQIRGRVGSLLEVGTGFHPELTGRENIFLSSSILGMRRTEIMRHFDEIVAFAEVERFLDTPIKHYSSGMYLRLAFAVAAHLQPEILLVDEVLAVGDATFQRRCLGKMNDVARSGRTVLFVSHNLAALQSICGRALWIEAGRLVEDGEAGAVVGQYLKCAAGPDASREWPDPSQAPGNELVRLRAARVVPDSPEATEITVRTPVALVIEYWNLQPWVRLNLSVSVYNQEGVCVFVTTTVTDEEWYGKPFPRGLFRSACRIPGDLLNDGVHRLVLRVVRDAANVIYQHDDLLSFEVLDEPSGRGGWYGRWVGSVRPRLPWRTEQLDTVESDEPAAGRIASGGQS